MADLTGISKKTILCAEMSRRYLHRNWLEKICVVLGICPESIMDNEYRFFYEGYGQAIEFLISKLGTQGLVDALQLKESLALPRWIEGRTLPRFEKRRALVKLFNELSGQIST